MGSPSTNCWASARVGAIMSASGPWPFSRGPAARIRENAGARKPSVLPLPVRAIATMSAPDIAHGHAW